MSKQRLNRRQFMHLAVGAGAGTVLAACAPKVIKETVEVVKEVEVVETQEVVVTKEVQEVVTATPGPAPEPVTVNYWAHPFEPRVNLDKVYIQQFTDLNPYITVVHENPGEETNKVVTALAAGVGPDLFPYASPAIPAFFYQETIVPVDYTALGLDEAQFMDLYLSPENTLQGCTFEGKLYGIPNEISDYAFFTNNALWEEAGLDPENDVPTTWEELVPIAEQLTKRDASGNLLQRGFVFGWDAFYMFFQWGAMLRQLGGSELSKDLRTCTIDTPEGAKVLQYWKDWVDEKRDIPLSPTDQGEPTNGTIASWAYCGSWAKDMLDEAGIEYTVHPVPRWADGPNNNGFDTYAYFHMVNSTSDPAVMQAAWQLAWFLDSHPVRYLESCGLLQPQKKVEESDVFKSIPYLDVFLGEMKVSTYSPQIPGLGEVADALGRTRDRSCIEGMDVEESLAQGKEEIDKILDESWAAVEG